MKLGEIVTHKPSGVVGKLIVHSQHGSSLETKEGRVYNVLTKDLSGSFIFEEGQRVVKYKGSYTARGEVLCRYLTKAGSPRYVVEYDLIPLQHIHSESDLMDEGLWLEHQQETFG